MHFTAQLIDSMISIGTGKILLLKEASLYQLGTRDKAEYFTCEATVLFIPSERAIYQSCPSKECKRKVKKLVQMFRNGNIHLIHQFI